MDETALTLAAEEYAEAAAQLEAAKRRQEQARRSLEAALGDAKRGSSTLHDGRVVRVAQRASRRTVDAAKLLAEGFQMSDFATWAPTVSRLRELAERQGWDESAVDQYLVDDGRTVLSVRIEGGTDE